MVYGIDPDPERVRVAAMAIGANGVVTPGRAPDLPQAPGPADLLMMLDMIHYINDDELQLTLQRISGVVASDARIIIRAGLPPVGRFPWAWWWEKFNCKLRGIKCTYRSFDQIVKIIEAVGYTIERTFPSGSKGDLVWLEVKTG